MKKNNLFLSLLLLFIFINCHNKNKNKNNFLRIPFQKYQSIIKINAQFPDKKITLYGNINFENNRCFINLFSYLNAYKINFKLLNDNSAELIFNKKKKILNKLETQKLKKILWIIFSGNQYLYNEKYNIISNKDNIITYYANYLQFYFNFNSKSGLVKNIKTSDKLLEVNFIKYDKIANYYLPTNIKIKLKSTNKIPASIYNIKIAKDKIIIK